MFIVRTAHPNGRRIGSYPFPTLKSALNFIKTANGFDLRFALVRIP